MDRAFFAQTTVYRGQLGASFGFAILAMIIIDAIAQLNAWRIIAVAKKPGQDIANMVFPGLGYFVSALVVAGGLAFNIPWQIRVQGWELNMAASNSYRIVLSH